MTEVSSTQNSKPSGGSSAFWRAIAKKLTISAQLLAKDVRRLKLKYLDLARADLQLGKSAYGSDAARSQDDIGRRIDDLTQRIASVRESKLEPPPTIAGKLKVMGDALLKAVRLFALHTHRRRLFRKLGERLRNNEPGGSLAQEMGAANTVAHSIHSLEADRTRIAPNTYLLLRRPLALLICLFLLLGVLGWYLQGGATRNASSSSEAAMANILAQGERFAEESRRRQEQMSREEGQRMQERIAAAARTYAEQAARDRAERAKVAAAEEVAERKRQAEEAARQRVEQEQRRIAEARAEQERIEQLKAARAEAERQREEGERIAAEKRRQEEEQKRALQVAEEKRQREEDDRAAQKIPASQLIAKSDLEGILGFALKAPENREVDDALTRQLQTKVEEASACYFAATVPPTSNLSHKGVMLTVRYLREQDVDHAETIVRQIMKADYQTIYDFDRVPDLGYAGFFRRSAIDSIYVFKNTRRGCTLLQVGIDGSPSEESSKDTTLWSQHMLDRETKIAHKILGAPRDRIASYLSRHPRDEEEVQSSYLPDIPGVETKVLQFFDGFYKRAASADASRRTDSKSVVAASGGAKMLCPQCNGSKLMVTHEHDSGMNPYGWGTLEHGLYENGREKTNFVPCDRCGGTGVVNAR